MYSPSSQWFYYEDESVKGPHSLSELEGLKAAGKIAGDTLVCPEGDENWVPLHEVTVSVALARVAPPPLPTQPTSPPPLPVPKAPKKWVWFSKMQIAGLFFLVGFGLMRLVSCSETPTSSPKAMAPEPAAQVSDVSGLNEKLEQAIAEVRSIGFSLIASQNPNTSPSERQKHLREVASKAESVVPKLREISRYGEVRKWSSTSRYAFESLAQIRPEMLITELGISGTLQNLRNIEMDLRLFPNGAAVRF